MATYTERLELKEEILPDQTIQLRVATVVERDGEEVGRQYHRSVFVPGSDLSEAPDEVKVIADALWTPAVVAAYEASIAEVEEVPAE
jgi:hypothetical protein